MSQSPLGLLFRINADPSQAETALEGFRSTSTEQMESVRAEFSLVEKGQAEWSSSFITQGSLVETALLTLGQAATATFDRFAESLGKNVSMALVYSGSMNEALDRTLKSTTASIAAEAVVQGLRSTALGFYLLAVGDFAGATSAFESAALWGSIGGVAAGIGASIPGGGSSSRSGASSSAGRGSGSGGRYGSEGSASGFGGYAPASAPSSLAPGSQPAPGGQLQVVVIGPQEAGQWFADSVINPYVARGGTVMASQAVRGSFAGG